MKLSDDEVILFGAFMFAGGANYANGKPVSALATMEPGHLREAKKIAGREFATFKREIKKRRTN